MILKNGYALQIFIVTFLAMAVNFLLSVFLFVRAKSKSKDKKSFVMNLIFFVIIPELLVLSASIYAIFNVVKDTIMKY